MPLSPKLKSAKPASKSNSRASVAAALPESLPASLHLSRRFTLASLTHSDTADKHRINNAPVVEHLVNLKRLAYLLESVETLLGHPLTITSAYRNPEVNALVGGVPTSKHALGLAADFVCPGFGTPLEVAKYIAASGISFDQIIHEFGRWVHLGLAQDGITPRRQTLTICRAAEGYLDGLLPCASETAA